ncbi:yd repeat protein [Bacillus sp. OxB-1]|nr:yd repeat protein [Bacillus sp. OxB-1]
MSNDFIDLLDGNSRTGWNHIYKRHVSGTSATNGTTLFPKALGDAKIKDLVMESSEKGTLKSTHADGTKVYTYIPKYLR